MSGRQRGSRGSIRFWIEKTRRQSNAFPLRQRCHLRAPLPGNSTLFPVGHNRDIRNPKLGRDRGGASQLVDQFIHKRCNITIRDCPQAPLYVNHDSARGWLVLDMPRLTRSHPFMKECGFRLEAVRLALELSQKDAARDAGVSQSAWANWEAGIRLVDASALTRFAQLHGITTDWVYRGSAVGLPAELVARLLGRTATNH